MIKIITGEISDGAWRMRRLERLGWGRCFIERLSCTRSTSPDPSEPFIIDNGVWRDWNAHKKGKRADPYIDEMAYMTRRWKAEQTGHEPLFAVIPDIIAGGMDSLDFSRWWIDIEQAATEWDLRCGFWPWYLAVQDGMDPAAVEELLADQATDDWQDRYQAKIAGLFIGGTDEFKKTAPMWAELAHRYGLGCHFGRCSTPERLAEAVAAGCDSCDSAFFLWKDERFVEFALAWLDLTDQDEPELRQWLADGAPVDGAA